MNTPNNTTRTRDGLRRVGPLLALGVLMFGAAAGAAQTPTLIANHATYLPGEDIVLFFSQGPGNPKDWIGLYPEGIEPGTGTPSTRWYYVDGTQAGTVGLSEGAVVFPGGLNLAGDWAAFLLLDNGYSKLAETKLRVADPTQPFVRPNKAVYSPGEGITVMFTNGPANPKDWIGIYPANRLPGDGTSLLWAYVNGTQAATVGLADGTVGFPAGLGTAGAYIAYLLLNDTYEVLASEPFAVAAPVARARVVGVQPAQGATGLSPQVDYAATLTNDATKVVVGSIKLKLDDTLVTHVATESPGQVRVTYTPPNLLAPESTHTFELVFADDGVPPVTTTTKVTFTVGRYRDVVLPAPLYFENFDSTPEGELPPGWTQKSFTDVTNPELDLGNLDSASYATWVVVNAARFEGEFVVYSDPNAPQAWKEDYRRVLSVNPLNVVQGRVLKEPLAKNRFVFGDSGYRNGRSQVLYLETPDFDLSGQSDIFVSFHSLWEQNQDSLGAVEYSIDQGATWLPIVYMLDGPDVVRNGTGDIDAVATFNTAGADIALYTDPDSGEEKGGSYGAFIGAEVTAALAPFISPRVNDDAVESKRVELFRLPQADRQAKVRLRFAHAGTDSWYFGVDDFGLYSIPVIEPPAIRGQPKDATAYVGDAASFGVTPGGTGPFTYAWLHNGTPVPNGTSADLAIPFVHAADAGVYTVKVSNASGTIESAPATLTVNPLPGVVTGVWNFDGGDLSLSGGVGLLEYADGEATQTQTAFGASDGTTVPHIGGQAAKYVQVPAFAAKENGYNLTMPTTPVGTDAYVNRYTMIWDLYLPDSVNWTPLFNTNPGNNNDADFYVSDTGQLGIGALGYSPAGGIEAGNWYRIAFAANLVSGRVTYYVNGTPVRVRTGGSLAGGRFALYSDRDAGPDLRLFNEPTGDYTHALLLNSFLFTSRVMSDEEILALGGPTAAGLPVPAQPLTLGVAVMAGGKINFSWTGGTGPFTVLKTTSLSSPNWLPAGGPTAERTFSEDASGVAAFYRVMGQ